jgi:hypothetical protein
VKRAAEQAATTLKQSGTDYGNKLASPELAAQAKAAGVNQFAKAEVGEGYASYSTRAGGGGGGGHTWGYHYAGVVAESLDRGDQVTLENYNRGADTKREQQKLFNKILADNAVALQQAYDALSRDITALTNTRAGFLYKKFKSTATQQADQKRLGDMQVQKLDLNDALTKPFTSRALKAAWVVLHKNEYENIAEAEKAFTGAATDDPSKRWFFKMYGSGAGQSFHEQSVASGYFNAPLTLRVGKQAD